MLQLLLPRGDEPRGLLDALVALHVRLVQLIEPVLDHFQRAADLRDVVLRLLEIDGEVGAALAGSAVQRVHGVLHFLELRGLLRLELLPVGGARFLLGLEVLLEGVDARAHLLAFLLRRDARSGAERQRDRGEALHCPAPAVSSARRFVAQADSL